MTLKTVWLVRERVHFCEIKPRTLPTLHGLWIRWQWDWKWHKYTQNKDLLNLWTVSSHSNRRRGRGCVRTRSNAYTRTQRESKLSCCIKPSPITWIWVHNDEISSKVTTTLGFLGRKLAFAHNVRRVGPTKEVANEILHRKCQVIHISTNKRHERHTVYRLHGRTLEAVVSGKYLGLTISDDLSWHRHVDAVAAKASRTLGFLRRNLGQCTMDVNSTAHTSMVRPVTGICIHSMEPYQFRRHCQAYNSTKTGSSLCPWQLFWERSCPANMPIWVPYGLPIWDPYGECNRVWHGSHMGKPICGLPRWVPYNSPIKKKEML